MLPQPYSAVGTVSWEPGYQGVRLATLDALGGAYTHSGGDGAVSTEAGQLQVACAADRLAAWFRDALLEREWVATGTSCRKWSR
jgi:hypothetical protein